MVDLGIDSRHEDGPFGDRTLQKTAESEENTAGEKLKRSLDSAGALKENTGD